MMKVDQLTPELINKAMNLKNCSRKIFVSLCNCKEPKSSSDVAKIVGESRAYVNMRLNQLLELGYVKEVRLEHSKEKLFVVVQ